jgi:hypothetical protein
MLEFGLQVFELIRDTLVVLGQLVILSLKKETQ